MIDEKMSDMKEQDNTRGDEAEENRLIAERRTKLDGLRQAGQAFPNDFRRTHTAAAIHAAHAERDTDALAAEPVRVAVAGRMVSRRVMGKASFAHLLDVSGRIERLKEILEKQGVVR